MLDLSFDRSNIWHPYTSLTSPLKTWAVDHATGVTLHLSEGAEIIDGMSSWWSTIHGYNQPDLNQAIIDQTSKMAHVMFGGLTHEPAISLCKTLADISPSGLNNVFLSDSGSVAVEVALKMALQYWKSVPETNKKHKMLTIKHGYHGDTFGAMSVCDPVNSMHSLYQDILPSHYFADAPTSKPDESFNPDDLTDISRILRDHHQEIAALILEPVVQGAGGMRFYHSEFLKHCRQLCDDYGVLLIFDEIATGFGRTGKLFAAEHAGVSPDIMCVGKALTGGYMSLAATLCNDNIATTIGQGNPGVFMHGPTFMGNPLACAVANKSLALLLSSPWQQRVSAIEQQLKEELLPLNDHPAVADARVMGAIGVIEMKEVVDVPVLQQYFVDQGVWIRPFNKLIYIMPAYIMTEEELRKLTTAMTGACDLMV